MLKIRLQRTGRTNEPQYRVVVTESERAPQSGNYIEMLGSYNPKMGKISIAKERAVYWMSQGAQLSPTMYNFFVDQKIIEGRKKNALPNKKPSEKRKKK